MDTDRNMLVVRGIHNEQKRLIYTDRHVVWYILSMLCVNLLLD